MSRLILHLVEFYEAPELPLKLLLSTLHHKPLLLDATLFKNYAIFYSECLLSDVLVKIELTEGKNHTQLSLDLNEYHQGTRSRKIVKQKAPQNEYCQIVFEYEKCQSQLAQDPLQLLIKSCQMKIDTDFIGKMDPFLRISLGTSLYRTKTVEDGGKTAKWNEQFSLERSGEKLIMIQFWQEDLQRNQFLGWGKFDIKLALDLKKEFEYNVPIFSIEDEEVGKVLIDLKRVPQKALEVSLRQALIDKNQPDGMYFRIKAIRTKGDSVYTSKRASPAGKIAILNETAKFILSNEAILQFQLLDSKESIVANHIISLPDLVKESNYRQIVLEKEQRFCTLIVDLKGQHLGADQSPKPKAQYLALRSKYQESKPVQQSKQLITKVEPIPAEKAKAKDAKSSEVSADRPKQAEPERSRVDVRNMLFYKYLNEQVREALLKGIEEVCKKNPVNPLEFLGRFLMQFRK